MTKAVSELSAVEHVWTIIVWQLKFIERLLCAWQMRRRTPKDACCTFPCSGMELHFLASMYRWGVAVFSIPRQFHMPAHRLAYCCTRIRLRIGGNLGKASLEIHRETPHSRELHAWYLQVLSQFKTPLLFIQYFIKCTGTSVGFLFPEQDFHLEVGLVFFSSVSTWTLILFLLFYLDFKNNNLGLL